MMMNDLYTPGQLLSMWQPRDVDRENSRPDIDLARLFVEEEHVLEKHEPARLRDGRKEAVQDAGRHKGLEGCGPRTPSSRRAGDDEEPKDDRETAKVGAQNDDLSLSSQSIGSRVKAMSDSPAIPPAPSINTFPACEWLT